jgi:hypothetical protein
MWPISAVECIPHRQTAGQTFIGFARSRIPPTAHFTRMPRIPHIDNHIKLIIIGIAGFEICGARRHMHELAIDEP